MTSELPETGTSALSDGGATEQTPALPPTVHLTSLKTVTVSSVWPTEAQHFTPWLLQNSQLLSELLGIDVELETREHKVGKFSLDIIGREVTTGAPVIVKISTERLITATLASVRDRVRNHRERLRKQGLRPIQL